jgi:enamine deaminase RidA (YjgF/YER057c/UK114 family)
MATKHRINVNSGRPLEILANYLRALRVGDMVMQTGTTAIDTEGNVIGEGDMTRQVDAIVDIARQSMGKAGATLDDVVRRCIFSRSSGPSRTAPMAKALPGSRAAARCHSAAASPGSPIPKCWSRSMPWQLSVPTRISSG